MDQYDVIVVGAGPAGSQTARLIAQRGHRVLVLEEHPQVGTPVHCSGFVTPRTFDEAHVSDGIVSNAIRGAIVYSPRGRPLTLGGDKVRAMVLDRAELDRRLAVEAQNEGAELRVGVRLVGITKTANGVTVQARKSGVPVSYAARLVVGADGVRSRVAMCLRRTKPEMVWCMGADVRLPDHPPDMVRVYVGRSLAPGWFGWSIPLGGNKARVGIGGVVKYGAPKPRRLFETLLRTYPEHFRGMEVQSYGGGFIPLYGRTRTYADRTLLVGDAALQVKATSGGGIYMSLVGARHAAPVADQALRKDRLEGSGLSVYEESWRRELGEELERGRDVRRAYLSLNDDELDRLVELFDQPVLRPIINRDGDIDYPSRMFGRLLGATPLLGMLLRIPAKIPSRWLRVLNAGPAVRGPGSAR